MAINEKKMQIVIDNYFKSECNVDTSIRDAFEKGFRIGVKKTVYRPKGEWIGGDVPTKCPVCDHHWDEYVYGPEVFYDGSVPNFCPNCGARMKGEEE